MHDTYSETHRRHMRTELARQDQEWKSFNKREPKRYHWLVILLAFIFINPITINWLEHFFRKP